MMAAINRWSMALLYCLVAGGVGLSSALDYRVAVAAVVAGTLSLLLSVKPQFGVMLYVMSVMLEVQFQVGSITGLRPSDLVAILLVFTLAQYFVTSRRSATVGPLAMPFLVLTGSATVTLVALGFRSGDVVRTLQYAEMFFVYIALVNLMDRRQVDQFLNMFVILGCAEALLAALQVMTGHGYSSDPTRGAGTLQLYLGDVLAMALLVVTARLMTGQRSYWNYVALVLLGGGVIFSKTRSTWGAIVAAIIMALILVGVQYRRRLIRGVLFAAAISVLVAVVLALFNAQWLQPITDRFASISDILQGNLGTDRTWTTLTRLALWRAGWAIFLQNPIVGAGAKSFSILMNDAIDWSSVAEWRFSFDSVLSPHNQYVFSLAENGLLGLGAFLLMLKKSANFGKSVPGVPGLSLLAVTLFIGVKSTVGDTLTGPVFALWTVFMAISAVTGTVQNHRGYSGETAFTSGNGNTSG